MSRHRRTIVGFGVLAAAPWLLGAASEYSSVEDTRTVVNVVGRAEQPRRPPFVVLTAGVESDERTASRAMRVNADTLARLRDVLGRMSIPSHEIKTIDLSLSPHRDPNDRRRVIGFKADHRISIVFRDIEQSGSVIDALVDAGATNVDGPRVSWWRSEPGNPQAREVAIRDANKQAHAYARSLGLRVRRVLKMSDGGSYASDHPRASARSSATEIMPGQEVVHTTVSAEYELVK